MQRYDYYAILRSMALPKFLTTVTSFSKILAAVLFITLPFAGFYLGLQYEAQFTQYLEDRSSLDQYNLNPSPSKTQDASTANWKTYTRSAKYGFEIKYQPYWETGATEVPDFVKENILSWDFFNNYNPTSKSPCLPYLNLTIYNSTKIFSQDWIKNLGKLNDIRDLQDQSVKTYVRLSPPCGYDYSGIIELKNKNTLFVSVGQLKDQKETQDIFDQILSTFKFTN